MTRIFTAAWAAFGLVVAGSLAAIVVTGLLEGTERIPNTGTSAAGVVVFLAAMLLAGKVCHDIAGRQALIASGVTTAFIGVLGWAAVTASESHGEGLEIHTLVYAVTGLAALLGSSVWLARRRASGRGTAPDALA